jgi:hypothetical protein
MARQLTSQDFKQSLNSHAAAKGQELFEKYGPRIGWKELLAILEDRAICRYPCEIVFDSGPLGPGEFAYPAPKGERPEDGFRMHVHPLLEGQPQPAIRAVLYQLAAVNYGPFASSEDAEVFGAAALGLSQDDYYEDLCQIADSLEQGPGACGQ